MKLPAQTADKNYVCPPTYALWSNTKQMWYNVSVNLFWAGDKNIFSLKPGLRSLQWYRWLLDSIDKNIMEVQKELTELPIKYTLVPAHTSKILNDRLYSLEQFKEHFVLHGEFVEFTTHPK